MLLVIVGKGRTFGKGLVQNVQDLPYQTALKYTVAKYYTPSGRCIQSTEYKEGGRGDDVASSLSDGTRSYKSRKVADKDRSVFYTAHGVSVLHRACLTCTLVLLLFCTDTQSKPCSE